MPIVSVGAYRCVVCKDSRALLLEELVFRAAIGQLAAMLREVVQRQPLGSDVRGHRAGRHVSGIEHAELDAFLAEDRAHGSSTGVMHRRGVAGDEYAPRIVILQFGGASDRNAGPLAVSTNDNAFVHRAGDAVRLRVCRGDGLPLLSI